MKIRLQPIRVFCFHQVSDVFDESCMWECDWMSTKDFKTKISTLQKKYTFIPLQNAYDKMKHDNIRFKKYAVLTADDGDATLRNVLPWLDEKKIPVTLFINPVYLDGQHYRIKETELYLKEDELLRLYEQYPLVSIGSHGWVHKDAVQQTDQEFEDSLMRSISYLKDLPNYVPFFAFPYGHYTNTTYATAIRKNVIPVLIDGNPNYTYSRYVDREMLVI